MNALKVLTLAACMNPSSFVSGYIQDNFEVKLTEKD